MGQNQTQVRPHHEDSTHDASFYRTIHALQVGPISIKVSSTKCKVGPITRVGCPMTSRASNLQLEDFQLTVQERRLSLIQGALKREEVQSKQVEKKLSKVYANTSLVSNDFFWFVELFFQIDSFI